VDRTLLTPRHNEASALFEQARYAEAETRLREILSEAPQDAMALKGLARLARLQAKVTAPADPAQAVKLAQELSYLKGPPAARGADEGARIDRATELVLEVLPAIADADKTIAANILWRGGQHEAAARLGGPLELARLAVDAGAPHALLYQLAKAETDADRYGLLAEHRRWAERLEAAAAGRPVARPLRPPRERLRLGFLSSDLRIHVVGYFVQPLFQFIDPRFELFIYSPFQGKTDYIEEWFAGRAAGFRQLPAEDAAAAQMIADDGLDALIDLSGPTSQGRPSLLAYKPAPLQMSWLGYPHSLGLLAIDRYIADPFMAPTQPGLLLEEPLLMPASWICMAPAAFQPSPAVIEPAPVVRNGHVTFGTANDPYKWTPRVLQAWARTVAATPGARMLFVRPEVGSRALQGAVTAIFAEAGVGPERLEFRALRGAVRPAYGDIDIALDTFPVTGGTTTCEAAWMGTPTVTLAGPATYERLSLSILTNLGLADLCATSVEDFVRIASDLGRSPERIGELRSSLRTRIRASALGNPERFAADFYRMIAGAIAEAPGQAA
jgi:predicted O-linked N-acetylglucosamine transferase (SPINDLY family)